MSFRFILTLLAAVAALAACSPTFNWRFVTVEGAPELKALLPCKPDQGTRPTQLAGQLLDLRMTGCEAGGALFAIAHVTPTDASSVGAVQQAWQAAVLNNMQASTANVMAYTLKRGTLSAAPLRLSAQGRRADGSAVSAQMLWLARGGHLYHAAVYTDRLRDDTADTFFAGLEFP